MSMLSGMTTGKEILLPAIPSVILDLDPARRLMRVHLLEGLDLRSRRRLDQSALYDNSMNDKRYWIGFNLIKGIGAVRMQALIQHFGDLEVAWRAAPADLAQAGLGLKVIERVIQARENVDLEKVWAKIESQGIKILTWEDEAYPQRLKEIDQPPPVLYIRGEYLPDDLFAVAIVGTRRVTPYGRQITEELASFLAANGITVISGLARGVDAIAHQTALKAGGRTIGVLGSVLIRSIHLNIALWQNK